ncbi:hypothetical protein QQF64_008538 [Cirrhinus molitorella]|uniref:Secreted protein n=1 Tax=Cirrhinus molitorella TaxID=172907 RepID=A0ABR3M8Y4_9TELE
MVSTNAPAVVVTLTWLTQPAPQRRPAFYFINPRRLLCFSICECEREQVHNSSTRTALYVCVCCRGTKAPYLRALAFPERISRIQKKRERERGAQWGYSWAPSPREGTKVEY